MESQNFVKKKAFLPDCVSRARHLPCLLTSYLEVTLTVATDTEEAQSTIALQNEACSFQVKYESRQVLL